jgi:hypothetical protein
VRFLRLIEQQGESLRLKSHGENETEKETIAKNREQGAVKAIRTRSPSAAGRLRPELVRNTRNLTPC